MKHKNSKIAKSTNRTNTPDPLVYRHAEVKLVRKEADRLGQAIKDSFAELHPGKKLSGAKEYIRQISKAFGSHPWFDGASTERNRTLRSRACDMMYYMCYEDKKAPKELRATIR